jgi:DNA-binding transcriptional LysR family regulator
MLTRYMLKYPQVELFIESTNRRVDLHEGFDLALRVRFRRWRTPTW